MAISINYITNEIIVPKEDTIFVEFDPINGREKRELDVLDFKKKLGDLQDNQSDVWAATCFANTSPQDLGSFVLGRSLLILSPYFVTFEAGTYSVNLINGNSNIATRSTVNGVVIIPNNSGGLVEASTGGGGVWTEEEKNQAMSILISLSSKLPTGTISSTDDVTMLMGQGLNITQIAQLQSIFDKLPSNGAEIAGEDDALSNTSPWSSLEKDNLIIDLDTTKRQATKAANNTESI